MLRTLGVVQKEKVLKRIVNEIEVIAFAGDVTRWVGSRLSPQCQ